MKKHIFILFTLIFLLSFFCACNKNVKSVDNTSTRPEKTSANFDSEYELGRESYTTVIDNENEKQIVHIDEFGDDIIVEHCDENGEVIYFEEPVYNNAGEVIGYKYYDKEKNYIAALDTDHSFYDKDGNFISENDFEIMINKLK